MSCRGRQISVISQITYFFYAILLPLVSWKETRKNKGLQMGKDLCSEKQIGP